MKKPETDIQLFNQTDLDLPITETECRSIMDELSEHENCSFSLIELVYVDEDEITRINSEHLDHDYVTDIITFYYEGSEDHQNIEGTLYCCAPRIFEQAKSYNESSRREFRRVFIHGLLHLAGYDDQSREQKSAMRAKEDFYLGLGT